MENNYLNANDKILKQQLEAKLANGTITDSEVKDLANLTQKDVVSDANLKNACASGASAGCINEIKLALAAKESYQGYAEYQTYYDLRDQFPEEMAKFGDLIGDYSRDLLKLVDQGYTPEQAKAKMAQDVAYAAKYQKAIDEIPEWAKIATTIQDTVGMVYGAKAAGVSLERLATNGVAGSKAPVLTKNTDGIYEVKSNSTPLEGQQRLNTPDVNGNGKYNPAEAAAAARLEGVLGPLERAPDTGGKTADFIISTGPNAGKTVDFMYTTKNLSQKEIDGINKFFEKNMTTPLKTGDIPGGQKQILEHLEKADIVPVDFTVLTPSNQKVFMDYIKTLPKNQQSKIIIMR